MAGLPPNYNFTNQYDPQLQASISQLQQHQQQQLQQQQQQQLQQPLFQHSQTQLQHIQQQQLHQQQTFQQQQTQLIQQLHQEARDRRERIRSKPFPTNVTQSVRDRQARGKDVYRSSEDEKTDDEEDGGHEDDERRHQQQNRERQPNLRKGLDSGLDGDSDDAIEGRDTDNEADILRCCRAEGFETRQRRAFAASVLDRPEQLMMYAQSEHDSIAGQRHRFMTIMCGYEDEDYWSNVGHHRAVTRAARERQANMRKAMNINRRTA
ncbi:hypothetical protein MKX08_004953 [Trichoderma sp. CBMAI-0020]|nr:hypothetical protein MKX08_004953 [Trichoderma sp. CBMAI-0020]